MKKIFLLTIVISLFSPVYSQKAGHKNEIISIIPQPVSVTQGKGSFTLPYNIVIITPKNEEVKRTAQHLSKQIRTVTNQVNIKEGTTASPKSIFLSLSANKNIPKNGYQLKITTSGVTLIANEPSGIFYGVQTLLQLFSKEIAGN